MRVVLPDPDDTLAELLRMMTLDREVPRNPVTMVMGIGDISPIGLLAPSNRTKKSFGCCPTKCQPRACSARPMLSTRCDADYS